MTGTGLRRTVLCSLIGLFVVGVAIRAVVGGSLQSPEILVPISVYAVVGAIIASHRPENPIGWVFLGIGGVAGLMSAADVASYAALGASGATPWWGIAGSWVLNWVWYPLLALMTLFTFLLYPTGLPSPRWRPVLWIAVTALAVLIGLGALSPHLCLGGSAGECQGGRVIANPLSPGFMAGVGNAEDLTVFTAFGVVLALCVFASVGSALVRTFRSSGVEKLQMRWFAFAAALLVLEMVVESHLPGGGDSLFSTILLVLALTAIPLSCGLAIMRYRLFEIDRIISRTLSYALVTGLLLAVYALVVTAVTRLLPGTSSSFSVAAATLAAAALFQPLLTRVRRQVDHRFNRSSYDAQRTIEQFAGRLRDEVSAEQVSVDLVRALHETLQPSAAGLWLRDVPR